MSSLTTTDISISKKELTKSRVNHSATKKLVFHHKASVGALTINLMALSMPSEVTGVSQPSSSELAATQLFQNRKNLRLVSFRKGELIQGYDYDVQDGLTIKLKGSYLEVGADFDEIFMGEVQSVSASDLVVASAKTIVKTYELPVGQNILPLGVDFSPSAKVVKVFINGVLAIEGKHYEAVTTSNGYASSIKVFAAPSSVPYDVVVDFGVRAITDSNGMGAIEALQGSVLKLSQDMAQMLPERSVGDYLNASPSDTDRRGFGDMVLDLVKRVLKLEKQKEIIVWNSGILTPTISAVYHVMTANSFVLTPGLWDITMYHGCNSVSTTNWTYQYQLLSIANGNNTNVGPASIPTSAATVYGATGMDLPRPSDNAAATSCMRTLIRVHATTTIYHNSYASMGTPANARIQVFGSARKLED